MHAADSYTETSGILDRAEQMGERFNEFSSRRNWNLDQA